LETKVVQCLQPTGMFSCLVIAGRTVCNHGCVSAATHGGKETRVQCQMRYTSFKPKT